MTFTLNLTRRAALFAVTGSSVLYLFFTAAYYATSPDTVNERILQNPGAESAKQLPIDIGSLAEIPETHIVAHAPGWTLFNNLYMANGTLFIVSSESRKSNFPPIRMMTSTGLLAENTAENIAVREPTDQEMQIISQHDASLKWGGDMASNERNRVWTVEGNTLLVNEPWQFLNHYYHFVAELLLGVWAFLYGAYNPLVNQQMTSPFNFPNQSYAPPPLSRIIFTHASSEDWRDRPGFNSYFLRAAFPSLTVEVSNDWNDRVISTFVPGSSGKTLERRASRAWHFPLVLLADRSAAFRGDECGSKTQRIAAESWEYMSRNHRIDVFGVWWSSVRDAVFRFAGTENLEEDATAQLPLAQKETTDPQSLLPLPKQVTITYINRQSVRRHLIPEDHDALVLALQQLVEKKRVKENKHWTLKIVQPELLSKEEQIQIASETTIMLGVHGNGLTHLVLMKPNRLSTVIEIFYPGGFAHDYEWTARALGIRHFTIWNDTYTTYPNEPPYPSYPEGFQGTSIPVHGASLSRLIESRLEGTLLL